MMAARTATVYSNFKFLRFREQLEALARGALVAPVHVRIKPINRCNHRCWYCAYREDNLALGEDMNPADVIPEAKMFEIVEDLITMGVKAVTFSGGGEPLLYKPLPDVVRGLAGAGIRVAALTNGANLKGAMADAFADHGTWVRVSVDAWDDASYTRARGAPPEGFRALLENLAAFAARGSGCTIGASFIIGQDNHTHVADACRLLKQAGVRHVKLSGVVVGNDVAENNIYHALINNSVSNQIAEAKKLNDENFYIIDHYHELDDHFEKNYSTCPFIQYLTVIGANQVVYTCQDKAYTASGTLCSIAEHRFRDIWYSEGNQARIRAVDPSTDCRHHCVAHAKNLILHEYLTTDPDHAAFV